jgi:hypothetical protein
MPRGEAGARILNYGHLRWDDDGARLIRRTYAAAQAPSFAALSTEQQPCRERRRHLSEYSRYNLTRAS